MFFKQSILSDAKQNTEGLKIVYDDVAPYAKENSTVSITNTGLVPHPGLAPSSYLTPRSPRNIGEVPDLIRDDVTYPGYALCLPKFAVLDGRFINFPSNASPYGYISEEISNAKSQYTINPELTITFNQKFTSVGILITFNLLSGDYATNINIKWYSENILLSDINFNPNTPAFFCNNYVQGYDKIIITFYATSKPYRPIFVTRIDYGVYRDFLFSEINEVNCLQEINAISENVSINTLSTTIRTKSNIPFDLQKKQRLALYFNGKLMGNFYLKNGARKNRTDYYLDCHDAVGVLDGNEFSGGIYTGQTVGEVVEQIFLTEDFNYLLDSDLAKVKLYGYIPYSTKRNALTQIAFSISAIVDTSNYDGVIIYKQPDAATGEFTDNETFDNITLEHTNIVTGVRISSHSYQKTEEVQELYNDKLSGIAEIIFNEPYHNLSITGGTIKTFGDNFAYIVGTGDNVILTGKKYNHLTTSLLKENPLIPFNKNIVEVLDATLVHSENAEEILNNVYEYYQRAENVIGDVIVSNKLLGQIVDINTGYDGKRTGVIESYNYSFSNRSIRAEVKIHE